MSATETQGTAVTGGDDADERDALIGRVLGGKFRIDAAIGRGAMGSVYRAMHTALDKNVAVKVILPTLAEDPTFRKRFLREALVASRLDHPNSVQVIDYGTEPDGVTFIAMEFLKGRTLGDAMAVEGQMALPRVVDLMSQALSALAVAHELGIVHRDLKPENLMLLPKPRDDEDDALSEIVKVMDFGVATSAEATEGRAAQKLTTTAMIVGTPGYMSPEQLRGEKLDGRSDLYACGVMLFEMITGTSPFEADTVIDMAFKHIAEPVPRPSERLPAGCDPRLEALILRSMEKDRAGRFADARAMRTALRGLLLDSGSAVRSLTSLPPVETERAGTGKSVSSAAIAIVASPGASAAPPAAKRGPSRTVLAGLGLAAVAGAVVLATTLSSHHPISAPRTTPVDPPRNAHVVPTPPPVVAPPVVTPVVVPTPPVNLVVAPTPPDPATPLPTNHERPHGRHPAALAVVTPPPVAVVAPPPVAVVVAPPPVVTPVETHPVVAPPPPPVVAPPPPPAPALAHGAVASVAGLTQTGGAPHGELVSRAARAVGPFGQCAARQVVARGAASGLLATSSPVRVRAVIEVRDQRIEEIRLQGGPPWLASCAGALRDNLGVSLPAADDNEYTVTLDLTLAPQ